MKTSYLKYIASLLLFGSNGIIASHILLSSVEIVFTRTLIGSLFLAVVFVFTKQKVQFHKNKMHLFYLMISGLSMGMSWMFLYEAYTRIGVSSATLSYYSGPVIVMVLSPFLFKEKMTWNRLAGFLSVLAGMLFVNLQVSSLHSSSWGLFCGIMSALMYAFMVIFNKKAVHITGLENSVLQLCAAFLIVAVFLGFSQGFAIHPDPVSTLFILILGVVNTGIGCYFYFSSFWSLPVQTVAIFGYLEPLAALVFSVIFLKETLSGFQIAGALLILGGAAFGELFRRNTASSQGRQS